MAHIQSAGCRAQRKCVIRAHNKCWKYLLCAISEHGEARDFEFIGEDKDGQLESLWKETKIGDILPLEDVADQAERLLSISNANGDATQESYDDREQEDDQGVRGANGTLGKECALSQCAGMRSKPARPCAPYP